MVMAHPVHTSGARVRRRISCNALRACACGREVQKKNEWWRAATRNKRGRRSARKTKRQKQKRGRPLAANTADRGRWKQRDRALLTTLTAPVDRRAARWRSVYETDRQMTILCNDRNVFCFRNWPSKIE